MKNENKNKKMTGEVSHLVNLTAEWILLGAQMAIALAVCFWMIGRAKKRIAILHHSTHVFHVYAWANPLYPFTLSFFFFYGATTHKPIFSFWNACVCFCVFFCVFFFGALPCIVTHTHTYTHTPIHIVT